LAKGKHSSLRILRLWVRIWVLVRVLGEWYRQTAVPLRPSRCRCSLSPQTHRALATAIPPSCTTATLLGPSFGPRARLPCGAGGCSRCHTVFLNDSAHDDERGSRYAHTHLFKDLGSLVYSTWARPEPAGVGADCGVCLDPRRGLVCVFVCVSPPAAVHWKRLIFINSNCVPCGN
jgi:hypothetical protein